MQHHSDMAAQITSTLEAVTARLLWWAQPWTAHLSRLAVLRILARITTGSLLVIDESRATKHVFGHSPLTGEDHEAAGGASVPPSLHVELVVKSEAFWSRLLFLADIGFAECYMLGDVECNDLTAFFQLFISNRAELGNGETVFSMLPSAIATIGRPTNSRATSLLNTAAHYDISNDMFAAFLSKDMTYSCPIWRTAPAREPRGEVESLQDAQHRKLQRFIQGARIAASDHVLEIGTGWGSFAIEAVKQTGCRITSITLSRRQKELAERRVKLAGLAHRIEVKFMDYRDLPTPEKPFDKIISIEMIEAVGKAHLAEYFAAIHTLLNPDTGIAMFQCITIPEALHAAGDGKSG
ncbi:Cyclopropane-fatty-acyl-phospholipid synthase [Purpureocillium takamizusanense]|uniref:Cyclopropane-fatty-acyl-phospholipid synthase n=1 Tax=Purpureocillium takamizusanense TaxID=2060973 RepID=A0A9Q8QAD3_9HYPO|nr:Cyclopropane-fatty-acyl-phospholipid synthase [Purpureocillium takamizusanense]UNI15301.1 Cyclopropane-fatty-acyl-phospholipid synthase [Purpureocillium takamizusanense]